MSNSCYNPEKIKENRDQVIIKTSILGIAANIFLSAVKAIFGLMSNSIAIILDAVNNLSDALSSVITIVGTKLASKKPDKKHPLGYGRIEYLSAMTVAVIVLYAGITSLVESIRKIIRPQTADYSTVTLLIIVAAVIVKLILGRYVTHVGKKVNSGSLIASGKDASFDAILSASVLVSAIVYVPVLLKLIVARPFSSVITLISSTSPATFISVRSLSFGCGSAFSAATSSFALTSRQSLPILTYLCPCLSVNTVYSLPPTVTFL